MVDPDGLMLDPSQEGSVRLSVVLDTAVYEPGADYIGAVYIIRHGEPRLDVPLRIRCVTHGAAMNGNGHRTGHGKANGARARTGKGMATGNGHRATPVV